VPHPCRRRLQDNGNDCAAGALPVPDHMAWPGEERGLPVTQRSRPSVSWLRPLLALLSSLVVVLGFTAVGLAAGAAGAATPEAVQIPPPSGTSGTTVSPLQYNCQEDAPTCGQVGETYGWYDGHNVQFLYSENYYCAPTAASHDTATGCEAGTAPASADPTGTSKDGTSLGNTTHGDTLYIPVPIGFTPPEGTQCASGRTGIDHPPSTDLSALATALPGNPAPTTLYDAMLPGHDHVVTTRHGGLPEWWNVKVVPVTSQASLSAIETGKSLTTAQMATAVPTNVFLFFQVLPGTVPQATSTDYAATAPPGSALPAAPAAPPASQVEAGQGITNLKNQCGATAPNCQDIGITNDWITGQNVQALYTEQYFCDTSVSAASSTGCEAGAPPNKVPPGVSTPTAPSPTVTNGQIDPLYIPVPLYKTTPVVYTQCPHGSTCIDHPPSVDLSRLAGALGATPASLDNVPLPSHDHLLTTRNGDQPEWWNVVVVPVTSPKGLTSVESAKSYAAVKALENAPGSGIGVDGTGEVPTNAYLWFATLPGSGPTTPGPVQTDCVSHMTPGAVVGGAALDDGTGYYNVSAQGVVANFGGATCYGDMAGQHLNTPIVGMAVDRATGGYWLVAADGGVFSFNAPFRGSAGGLHLNQPVVGMTSTLNGTGYWLVAADGGVFAYDAPFEGSTGSMTLNKPVVGIGLDRATGGYWLVASDGGVFAYDAPFEGSTGSMTLNKPVVSIAPVSDGSGYRLVASDGGVFAFNAPFYGSAATLPLNRPVVMGLNNNSYDGYWLVASDGGVFTYGPPGPMVMPFFGSAA
jgi:hypothetical protein